MNQFFVGSGAGGGGRGSDWGQGGWWGSECGWQAQNKKKEVDRGPGEGTLFTMVTKAH